MGTERLIHDHEIAAGDHVRIWRQDDNRFLFEHLMPTGKGVTIVCATLKEALSLWKRLETDPRSEPFASDR